MEIRPPKLSDKEEVIKYIQNHYANKEKSLSASDGLTSMTYEDWLMQVKNNTIVKNGDWGRFFIFFAFDNDELVGILSLRPEIKGNLLEKYGHIGYGVKPNARRKGYATEMLNYAIQKCKEFGLEKVRLGCYKENTGSAKTIEKCGGVLLEEKDELLETNEYYTINLINQFYEIEC